MSEPSARVAQTLRYHDALLKPCPYRDVFSSVSRTRGTILAEPGLTQTQATQSTE